MAKRINRRWVSATVALAVISVLGAATDALADHVVLTNGDSLTGAITSASKNELTIDTELAGRITIKWSAASRVTSTTPLRAILATGQSVEGVPVVSNARLSIQPKNGTTVPVDLSTVRALDVATRPAGAVSWLGTLNAGLDFSRGNAETSTWSSSGTATRQGAHDRLGLFGTYLTSSIGSGTDAVTTARAARGGARYDHDLAGQLFGFGFADAENDPLQLLDLRTVLGGGAGAHVVNTGATQFNLFGGVSYARDSYAAGTTTTTSPAVTPPGSSGKKPTRGGTPPSVVRASLSRDVGEFLAGQDLAHQLSDNVSVTEAFRIFPAIGNAQDYRVSFDLSLSAQLNGWLQWNVTMADRYLRIPPAGGAVQNDTFVSMGLGITFGGGSSGEYTGSDGRRPAPPRKP